MNEDIFLVNRTPFTMDMRLFAQCRTCCEPMIGILSVKAREDCVGCGGEALNVRESPKPKRIQWLQRRL